MQLLPIQREFEDVYDRIMRREKIPSPTSIHRVAELRPSQLPFCAPSFWIENASKGVFRLMSLPMAYYTSVGTTVHTVMQRYMALSNKFLADWECKVCGKKTTHTHENRCCGQLMEYEELTVAVKFPEGVVSGHIDGVYRATDGHYYIIDYKTTSLSSMAEKLKKPPLAYYEQLRCYAYLLYKQFGIQVAGIMLVFIPRDNPRKRGTWAELIDLDDLVDTIPARISRHLKWHHHVMSLVDRDEALSLAECKPCGDPYCAFCELEDKEDKLDLISRAYTFAKKSDRLPLTNVVEREMKKLQNSSK